MGSLKASDGGHHAAGVAAPHHSQVSEDIGEAAPLHAGSLCPWESPMRHVANEGHSTFTEATTGGTDVCVTAVWLPGQR
jgi:hypothetical protein